MKWPFVHKFDGTEWIPVGDALAEIEKARREGHEQGWEDCEDLHLAEARKQGAEGERKQIVDYIEAKGFRTVADDVRFVFGDKPPAPPRLPEKVGDVYTTRDIREALNGVLAYLKARESKCIYENHPHDGPCMMVRKA